MTDEAVEHVIVEHPPDPGEVSPGAAVAVVVAAAEGAAALAHETAAAAELQAAERVATIESEAGEWRAQAENRLAEVGTGLLTLSERIASLDSRQQEREDAQLALLTRLEAMEAARQPTEPASPSIPEASSDPDPTQGTLAGTAVEVTAGPVAAEVSGGIGSAEAPAPATESSSPSAPPRRKRLWI